MKENNQDRGVKFAKYGWKVSEDNLNTLPETAPAGGKRLAEWLTLDGRRSSLVEWLGHVKDDHRIHGSFAHIGAWTGRMSHRNPNQANIPAEFHGEPKTAVEEVKAKYDGQFRALWCVPEGSWLVGTDAEGIQLRVLAHLMRSEEYVHAIVSGKKEDETDIHNLNRKALGMSHITRDMAKTFIYAFLLGAGNAKIAQILKVNQKEAGQAVDNFMESIEGLAKLKKKRIPEIASRGWFKGLDGRKVKVPSQHKTLAGMLQNGESTIMKHAITLSKLAEDSIRVEGYLTIDAEVEKEGERLIIPASELKIKNLKMGFREFQNFKGSFELANDVTAKSFIIRVNPRGRAYKSFDHAVSAEES